MTAAAENILCPYHGPRPATADSAGVPQCSACLSAGLDREVSPMNPYRPVAPRIVPAGGGEGGAAGSAAGGQAEAGAVGDADFSLKPAEVLLASRATELLAVDDVLPRIRVHIAAVELFLAARNLQPIGPLVLLYDHPDPADFGHVYFSAGYPVDPRAGEAGERGSEAGERISMSTERESRTKERIGSAKEVAGAALPPDPDGVERRVLPPMHVASVTFAGPWSELGRAYPVLRRAIENSGMAFGRLTLERYLVVGGTHDRESVTVIQRQLAP